MRVNSKIVGKMHALSLGLGVQSVALYFMSCLGEIPRFDYAIFADPKAEGKATYEYLKWLLQWQKDNNGIPIKVARERSIYKDLMGNVNTSGNRFASIPMFTKDENGNVGMLRRQCTNEYKIAVVDRAIRKICKLKKYKRNIPTVLACGISLDEIERMKVSQQKWKTLIYPLIEKRMTRMDCEAWLRRNNLPIPPKSACFFCPFQSDSRWLDMKLNKLHEWKRSVRVDYAIRNSTQKGVKNPAYLHPSCKPLDQVDFKNEQQYSIFQSFKNECFGMCGN